MHSKEARLQRQSSSILHMTLMYIYSDVAVFESAGRALLTAIAWFHKQLQLRVPGVHDACIRRQGLSYRYIFTNGLERP